MSLSYLKQAVRRLSLRAILRDRQGVISVETAIIGMVFTVLAIGVVDFSMAYSRKSEMSNAVRAGIQFALVRRPSIGPSATTQTSLVSLETIRQAVIDSASFLQSDPGTEDLNATVVCECADGSSVECLSQASVPLACDDRQTILQITFRNGYTPMFNYPLVPDVIELEAKNSVRLN